MLFCCFISVVMTVTENVRNDLSSSSLVAVSWSRAQRLGLCSPQKNAQDQTQPCAPVQSICIGCTMSTWKQNTFRWMLCCILFSDWCRFPPATYSDYQNLQASSVSIQNGRNLTGLQTILGKKQCSPKALAFVVMGTNQMKLFIYFKAMLNVFILFGTMCTTSCDPQGPSVRSAGIGF